MFSIAQYIYVSARGSSKNGTAQLNTITNISLLLEPLNIYIIFQF
jgi:hypothetical protein